MTRRAALLLAAALSAGVPAARAASVADGQRDYDAGAFDAARAIWSGLAQAGDAQAALDLGTLYERGDGVAADPEAAYCWYRRAATGGLPAAAFNVGVMHDSGRGTTPDAAAAAGWYARAAAFGFARAEFNLGQLYEAGEGVPRNPDVAIAWYRLAAASGLTAAADRVATLHPSAADAAAPPAPVRLDDPADPAGSAVPLTWTAAPPAAPVSYYVEVVATGAESPRAVFSATTALTATLATLSAGAYAGRVFSITADSLHYAVGGWTRFRVGPSPAAGACAPR